MNRSSSARIYGRRTEKGENGPCVLFDCPYKIILVLSSLTPSAGRCGARGQQEGQRTDCGVSMVCKKVKWVMQAAVSLRHGDLIL